MLLPTAYFAYNVAAGISNAMIDDTPLTMYDYMIVDQAKQIEDILTNSKLKMHYKFNSFNG
jgi:hypothetical protein